MAQISCNVQVVYIQLLEVVYSVHMTDVFHRGCDRMMVDYCNTKRRITKESNTTV